MKKCIAICDCCLKQVELAGPFNYKGIRVDVDFCDRCKEAFKIMLEKFKEAMRNEASV